MKKIIIVLALAIAANTACFAQDKLTSAAREVATKVKNAPSGTTYGIVEVTNDHIVVSSPLGRHTIKRNADGSFSFLGLTARIVSAKNGVYRIQTSLGTFSVNTRKGTVTKH
jgi:hypothetical protein